MMNKPLLSQILTVTFVIMTGLGEYSRAEESDLAIVELRQFPGKDPAMWDGVYAARSGKVYLGLIGEGASAHFYVYDPETDQCKLLYDMAEAEGGRGKGIRTSGKIHNKPVEDDHGNIYFVTMNNGSGPRNIDFLSYPGGHWFCYHPQTGVLEDLGLVERGVGLYPLAIDKERMLLYGIGFDSYLYRFNLDEKVSEKLGRVSNWDICRDIFVDDRGNVYGSFPIGRIWKHDPETEITTNLATRVPYDPTIFPTQLRNPMIDRSMDWRAIEWDPVKKAAYGVTCGSGSILFRFDPNDGPDGTVTALTKMCDSKFLRSDRKDIPYSTLAFAVDSQNQKVYFAPSARPYSIRRYEETFGSAEPHHLILYEIESGRRIDLGAMQTRDGRRVFGCEGASVAPDGTVYIVGQAEIREGEPTRRIGEIPVALQLIIYKP
jgi:hypothetical protein